MHRIMAGYGQVGDLFWPIGIFQDLGIQGEATELESWTLAMADRTEQVSMSTLTARTVDNICTSLSKTATRKHVS